MSALSSHSSKQQREAEDQVLVVVHNSSSNNRSSMAIMRVMFTLMIYLHLMSHGWGPWI